VRFTSFVPTSFRILFFELPNEESESGDSRRDDAYFVKSPIEGWKNDMRERFMKPLWVGELDCNNLQPH
jgi:hypothetical protein